MNFVQIFLYYQKIERKLKKKKIQKEFTERNSNKILKNLPFKLTNSQECFK